MPGPLDLSVYLVTDRRLAGSRGVEAIVAEAIRGGVTLVQLRDPDGTTRELIEAARALKRRLAPHRIALIINDRVDVALAVDADGVHVGQSDMPAAEARRLIGPDKWLGLSVTSKAEAEAALLEPVDYLGVGPIFLQSTKPDAAAPLGLKGLAEIRALTEQPIVAIGGVSTENAGAMLEAGADGLAIVSAIMAAPDPRLAAAEFAKIVATHRFAR